MGLTPQECHGAIFSVWNLSDVTFITCGGIKFEQFVHAAVVLVRGKQAHIEKVGFMRHFCSSLWANTRHVRFAKLLVKMR